MISQLLLDQTIIQRDQKYRCLEDSAKETTLQENRLLFWRDLEGRPGAFRQEKGSLLVTSNQRTLLPALGRFRFPGFPGARVREHGCILRVLRRGTREGWVPLAKEMRDWLKPCWGVPQPFRQG